MAGSGNSNLCVAGGRQYFDEESQLIKGVFTPEENNFIANFILNTPITSSGRKSRFMWDSLGKMNAKKSPY